MAANIYIYCPAQGEGLDRDTLEEELASFFGDAAEDCGAGSGYTGFNLDFELAEGTNPHVWADRLKAFLASANMRPGSYFDVFPDGWEPDDEWRRIVVLDSDIRRTDRPYSPREATPRSENEL